MRVFPNATIILMSGAVRLKTPLAETLGFHSATVVNFVLAPRRVTRGGAGAFDKDVAGFGPTQAR